jgi:hypothetical protein
MDQGYGPAKGVAAYLQAAATRRITQTDDGQLDFACGAALSKREKILVESDLLKLSESSND